MKFQSSSRSATLVSSAAYIGRLRFVGGALAVVLAACAGAGLGTPPFLVHRAEAPSSAERYCAWYGDSRGHVLYFGQAAFWSAFRAHGGDPTADLKKEGPVLIGRFDLRRGRLLEPLDVSAPGRRSGVWDVLAHPNGRVYFTTFYEGAGYVEPDSGKVQYLEAIGRGLNELAPGPDGSILISRYGPRGPDGHGGSVVAIDPDGAVLAEYPLSAPPGFAAQAKTVAYDALRGEIWVTTDLLPEVGGTFHHDALVLDTKGKERRRIHKPEIQFVAFGEDGTGYRAEVEGHELWLRVVPPEADASSPDAGDRILLDGAFPAQFDFAQDIQVASDGRTVVTRWSGWVHVVDPSGEARKVRLPFLDREGLYYTAVLDDGRLCATHCADVTVVCGDSP